MKNETKKTIHSIGLLLFIGYLLALTYFLFFAEAYGRATGTGEYSYNLVLLKEIKRFLNYREIIGYRLVIVNLVGNVMAFVPFGAILPILRRETRGILRIAILTLEFSLLVETIQLIYKVGSFDVDDLLLNTLGGVLGYGIFVFCNYLRRKFYG